MVTVIDDDSQPFNPLRSRVYFYGRLMNRDEYFHIKAFAVAGRTEGISPLRAFALTILNGLEATRYGTDWFRAGGFPPGTFKNNEIEIDAAQSAEIRGLLSTSIRRREPLVYGRDWDYHPGHGAAERGAVHRGDAAERDADRRGVRAATGAGRRDPRGFADVLERGTGRAADHRGDAPVAGPAGNGVLPDPAREAASSGSILMRC